MTTIDRRTFLGATGAALLTATRSRGQTRRPNIIVIYVDDLGWADLGAQGVRADIRTPNLDGLAVGGLRAVSGYVTAPQCVPSRAGLLAGRYQPRFGVESNNSALDGFNQQVTIAQRLKQAGYATGMTGKWHLGPPNEIVRHGFDDVWCNQGGGGTVWANYDLDGRTVPGAMGTTDRYHLEANAAAACTFIRRHAAEPFFFYLAFRAPHVPLDAPEKYTDRFPGAMPERRRQCLAMMSAVDDGIGEVMTTLRELNLEEQTLIFFMGDNGAPLMMTMEDRRPISQNGWDGSINAPLNGEKGMVTEGGIREPWLAYWPGRIPAGQVYPHPVISLDVAATAVALAGLPADPRLDGVDLLPYFTGRQQAAPHDVLYWRWIDQAAIREGQWKLIVAGARTYLFDLDADPGERHNLFADQPELAARLRQRLESWAAELTPPGLRTGPMQPVWEDHYDYHLDGQPPKKEPEPLPGPAGDWIARNAKAEVKNGALKVTPAAANQRSFIVTTKLRIPGPAKVTVSLRSEKGGPVGFAWRLDGQQDFLPVAVVNLNLPGSADWQEAQAELPADGPIIHLRVLLPPGVTEVRSVAVEAVRGKASAAWEFGAQE